MYFDAYLGFEVTSRELDEMFTEYLADTEGDVEVGDDWYPASHVLKQINPRGYQRQKDAWLAMCVENGHLRTTEPKDDEL